MCRAHTTLYTKDQTLNLFRAWGCDQPLPPKGKKVLVCFPATEIDVADIQLTAFKGDSGKKLYAVTFSSKAGRELDQTICEAHVLAYLGHAQSERRRAMAARAEVPEFA